MSRFVPKLFTVIREGLTPSELSRDILAGIVVGVVALPLAIAFAIASGVGPERGLYTAVVAGFLIALFGGSRVQVSGPTGAFVVVVGAIVQEHGYEGLAVATLLAGVMLVVMGMLRMGILLRFIPYPLIVGFTSGIAAIIFTSQLRDLLGVCIIRHAQGQCADKLPLDFIEKIKYLFDALPTTNVSALALGLVTIGIIALTPKLTKRIPGALIALLLVTSGSMYFSLPIETIGSRFGEVPNTLPSPAFPVISWELIQRMFSPALTIALLGAIESLLSAVVADGMIGGKHRSDMELIAQGIGNIASPMFGGIPATGAIARTATNVKNGGRTPVAGITHAVTLLVIMVFFAPWAKLIPMPVLAGILVVVAYHMSEWRSFASLFRSPRSDVMVLVTTFLLTVLIDLTVAIEVGIVLSALLFMRAMSSSVDVDLLSQEVQIGTDEESADPRPISKREIPRGTQVFEIHGPLFFGAVEHFRSVMSQIASNSKVLILRMRNVRRIDASGLHALNDVLMRLQKSGTTLLLSGLHPQPRSALERAGFIEKLSQENICKDIDAALQRARQLVSDGEGA